MWRLWDVQERLVDQSFHTCKKLLNCPWQKYKSDESGAQGFESTAQVDLKLFKKN